MTPAQLALLRALPRTGSVSLATLATSVHGEATEEQIEGLKAELAGMWAMRWVTWRGTWEQFSLTDAGRAALDGAVT